MRNWLRHLVISASLSLALGGCASIAAVQPSKVERTETIQWPAIGQKATGTLGTSLVTQGTKVYVPGIKLRQAYQTEWVRNSGSRAFPFIFDPDTPLRMAARHNGVPIYVGSVAGGLPGPDGKPVGNYGLGVRDDGSVAYVYLSGGVIDETPGRTIQFERTEIIAQSPDYYQQEFIYSGRNGDALFFTYREFKENVARPAFTQQATYSLKDGNVVGFMGLRLEVIQARNTEIEYRLLSSFR